MEPLQKNPANLKEYSNLHSPDPGIVLSALERIKESGNEGYLTILFDLLLSGPDTEVRKEILSILGSVKIKHATTLLMEAIEDSRYLAIRKELLTACWQNGLDFTPYFPALIQIIIESDWETAFEAFTIIENSEYIPDPLMCIAEVEKLGMLTLPIEEKKQYFLNAVKDLLSQVENNN